MLNHSTPIDPIFHALADPVRRTIVEQLSWGPASVSELAKPLPISLPGVMQHLAVLEQSGLVRSQKVGRVRTCTLDAEVLALADDWFSKQRQRWVRRLDRLGDFLAEEQTKTDD